MKRSPKVLFVATVEIHIQTFHLPYLKYFNDMGYKVHVACAGDGDIPYCHVRHSIPFERSPFRWGNIKSYFTLKQIMCKNQYSLIHCHTPVGGVIGRLAAARARKSGAKVLYTAHGFQFYKGGPVRDWMIYYTVEKILARFTDILITINQEDYDTAVEKKFKAGIIKKIDGIGLETNRFQISRSEKDIECIRKSLGLGKEDFVMLCVGELSKRKNQVFLLEVLKDLSSDQSLQLSIKLVLAGSDSLNGFLNQQAEVLNIAKNVIFLGHRSDIPELMSAADVAVSASRQEGLPFNILEAMASENPVVATDIRGHRDLIRNGVNGFLVRQGDRAAFSNAVKKLYGDKELRRVFGQAGALMSQSYSLETVMVQMKEIYNTVVGVKT